MGDTQHLTELLSNKKYLKIVIWLYIRGMIIIGAHFYPITIQSIGISIEDSILNRRKELRNEEARVNAVNRRLNSEISSISNRFKNGEITKEEEIQQIEVAKQQANEDIDIIKQESYNDSLFSDNYIEAEDNRRLDNSFAWSLLAMTILRWILQMYLLGLWGWWWRMLFTLMMITSILGNIFSVMRIGDLKKWYITDMSFTMFSMLSLFYEWMVGFL